MKRGLLQEKTKNGVRCLNCAHLCNLSKGDFGICGMRKNTSENIEVFNYGKLEALNMDPIEKKPIYHFLPETKTLSIASSGCSFKCKNCQNWRLSQRKDGKAQGQRISPKKLIDLALENNAKSISYTYGEPIIFLEYALSVMKLARKNGLKNIWVSNGYFSDQSLKATLPYIDAINIDLKSFSDEFYRNICGGRLNPVLKSIKKLEKETHLEITTLLIPEMNDSKSEINEISKFISNLNPDIPWHVLRFSAKAAKSMNLPDTPEKIIEMAYKIGKENGLNHIYPGNMISEKNNTYCPNCESLIIKRNYYDTEVLDKNACSNCNQKINLTY